jgi:hypothetical protein
MLLIHIYWRTHVSYTLFGVLISVQNYMQLKLSGVFAHPACISLICRRDSEFALHEDINVYKIGMATKKSPNLHIAEANIFYWKNNKYTKKYMYQIYCIYTPERFCIAIILLSGKDSEQLENFRSQFLYQCMDTIEKLSRRTLYFIYYK